MIGHTAGAGKHKGRVGALQVRLKNGIEFSVGTGLSDKERSSPPAVGSLITFRYQELSDAGVPRFPSYVGVRSDLTPASKIDTIPAKETKAGKTAVSLAAPTPVAANRAGVLPGVTSVRRRWFCEVLGNIHGWLESDHAVGKNWNGRPDEDKTFRRCRQGNPRSGEIDRRENRKGLCREEVDPDDDSFTSLGSRNHQILESGGCQSASIIRRVFSSSA